MKLLSLFSGIGAFEKALEKLGIEFELVNSTKEEQGPVKKLVPNKK